MNSNKNKNISSKNNDIDDFISCTKIAFKH